MVPSFTKYAVDLFFRRRYSFGCTAGGHHPAYFITVKGGIQLLTRHEVERVLNQIEAIHVVNNGVFGRHFAHSQYRLIVRFFKIVAEGVGVRFRTDFRN